MSKVDPRVPAMLEVAELKYRTDDDGDTIVSIAYEGDRSQVVFIMSSTFTYDDQEFRRIISPAHTGELPESKVLAYCLTQNHKLKVGSWRLQIGSDGENTTLILGTNLEANASPQRLKQVLFSIARTADELEQKLSEKDNF